MARDDHQAFSVTSQSDRKALSGLRGLAHSAPPDVYSGMGLNGNAPAPCDPVFSSPIVTLWSKTLASCRRHEAPAIGPMKAPQSLHQTVLWRTL
jgi:hypothetical protein